MNKKKLIIAVSKLCALSLVLYIGIPYVYQGFMLSQDKPPPENPVDYVVEMIPKQGGPVGKLTIRLQPTTAFVIGDKIVADIEVDVERIDAMGVSSARLRFVDCLGIDANLSSTNEPLYNNLISLDYNTSTARYLVFRGRAFLWFNHEGIFGANVTVYSPYSQQLQVQFGTNEGTTDWSFPQIATIKSYSYIEERANTQFTNALTLEILGLTIIAISPIAVTIISLIGRVYDSIVEELEDTDTT
jgi:hypothetical protein